MRSVPLVSLFVMTAMVLTGCTAAPSASGPKTTAHQTLDELRSAYTSFGGACPAWSEDDDIRAAAQSGTCGNGVTLSTYLNGADLLGEVRILRDTASGGGGGATDPPRTELLIGVNWLVAGPHVRQLQPKLGGQLMVINPAATN